MPENPLKIRMRVAFHDLTAKISNTCGQLAGNFKKDPQRLYVGYPS